MKKKIAIGLVMSMMLGSLTGCGTKSSEYLLDIKYSDYVKLCEYKGVEATKVTFDVSEQEIQEQVEENMYDYVVYEPITDRGAEVGDYANIDYAATLDGEDAEEYSGEGEDVMIGEGYIYTELEDALVGMKSGETKDVDVELTEDFADEEDIGKTISVKLTLNDISEEIMPEYNDDFVKENTDFKTVKEYEASIKKDIEETKEEEYKAATVEEIMQYLLDNSTFDGYPQELYDECEANVEAANEYYASMYGMELEDFYEMFGYDEETKKQEIEDNVHYELIVGAIAQKEGITTTEKKIKKFVDDNYALYGYEDADAFLADYSYDDIGYELIYESVMDFLYENAKYSEISEEEYLEQQQQDFMIEEDDSETSSEETIEIEDLSKDDESVDAEVQDGEDTSETTEEETTEETTEN